MADQLSSFNSYEEAQAVVLMTQTPGWAVFESMLQRYRQMYLELGVNTPHDAYALEKFRHYQTLAQNVVRIPQAIKEEAEEIIDAVNKQQSLMEILESEDLE